MLLLNEKRLKIRVQRDFERMSDPQKGQSINYYCDELNLNLF
jgi:hypothetical protein